MIALLLRPKVDWRGHRHVWQVIATGEVIQVKTGRDHRRWIWQVSNGGFVIIEHLLQLHVCSICNDLSSFNASLTLTFLVAFFSQKKKRVKNWMHFFITFLWLFPPKTMCTDTQKKIIKIVVQFIFPYGLPANYGPLQFWQKNKQKKTHQKKLHIQTHTKTQHMKPT